MKKIIGFLMAITGLAFIALGILRVWDISLISNIVILRSTYTLLFLCVAFLLLLLVYVAFFLEKEGIRYHR